MPNGNSKILSLGGSLKIVKENDCSEAVILICLDVKEKYLLK